MANPADKLPENVSGAYYVDSNCIDCDQCRETAPTIFARDPDSCHSFVQRQPSTPRDVALAEEALAACPSQAIGSDGA